MKIRLYRPGDLETLRGLTVEAFGGVSRDENIEAIFGVIRDHDWRWRKARDIDADASVNPAGLFIAEEEGRILGFVTTRVDAEAGIGWIVHLVVGAGLRGRGLGRSLIEHALEYFRTLGLSHARIETLEQNAISRHLFPKCGFVEVARQIHYFRKL
jgi:ribosomal protein S18 acetylase RimI-like enzyme